MLIAIASLSAPLLAQQSVQSPSANVNTTEPMGMNTNTSTVKSAEEMNSINKQDSSIDTSLSPSDGPVVIYVGSAVVLVLIIILLIILL